MQQLAESKRTYVIPTYQISRRPRWYRSQQRMRQPSLVRGTAALHSTCSLVLPRKSSEWEKITRNVITSCEEYAHSFFSLSLSFQPQHNRSAPDLVNSFTSRLCSRRVTHVKSSFQQSPNHTRRHLRHDHQLDRRPFPLLVRVGVIRGDLYSRSAITTN